ncbi:hypothetical protein GDO81_018397 [Engystomops pustulosus]|uniref:Uncharacterized protein n=1 Tax=Engystomops pustulosus TaxID=76066 RepID=A0AAV7AB08_ENGPU|nr:hypothetical protein GDO81_018397 [Engystomops pustulosus]
MHQNSVSKKGRSNRGTSNRVTLMVPGHEAAAGTGGASTTPRFCQKTEPSPRNQSDWSGSRGTRQDNSPRKISADARFPDNALTEHVAERGKRSALPLIKKGAGRVTGTGIWVGGLCRASIGRCRAPWRRCLGHESGEAWYIRHR